MIEAHGRKIYFAGDTAFGGLFKELGMNYGPIDYALVPIGAYNPRILMLTNHCNPEEAVQIGIDVGAKHLVGMHWGTVILTDEPPFEPPKRFRIAGRQAGFDDENVWLMRVGETRRL